MTESATHAIRRAGLVQARCLQTAYLVQIRCTFQKIPALRTAQTGSTRRRLDNCVRTVIRRAGLVIKLRIPIAYRAKTSHICSTPSANQIVPKDSTSLM